MLTVNKVTVLHKTDENTKVFSLHFPPYTDWQQIFNGSLLQYFFLAQMWKNTNQNNVEVTAY